MKLVFLLSQRPAGISDTARRHSSVCTRFSGVRPRGTGTAHRLKLGLSPIPSPNHLRLRQIGVHRTNTGLWALLPDLFVMFYGAPTWTTDLVFKIAMMIHTTRKMSAKMENPGVPGRESRVRANFRDRLEAGEVTSGRSSRRLSIEQYLPERRSRNRSKAGDWFKFACVRQSPYSDH